MVEKRVFAESANDSNVGSSGKSMPILEESKNIEFTCHSGAETEKPCCQLISEFLENPTVDISGQHFMAGAGKDMQ
uniref:Uncharacterized protein n=1 Tax=Solanum lycopersicum TaxID=4081 RepID=A0A3Q7GYG1_SOLLC